MISIVMAAYNAEKTILQSIKSVVQQSYKDWELIIVDDASFDETSSIVKSFIEKNINSEMNDWRLEEVPGDLGQEKKTPKTGSVNSEKETTIPEDFRDMKKLNSVQGIEYVELVKENLELVKEAKCYETERRNSFNIKLVRNSENRGVAFSRNKGIEQSQGQWIAFLDSDDMWEPDKLEKQMKLVERLGMKEGLVFTGSAFMDEKGKRLDYTFHAPDRVDRKTLLKQNVISCSSVVVSRSLAHKTAFPTGIRMIHEDFAVWLKILEEIEWAYGIDEPLLVYRISTGSKSARKSKAAIMNWNTYKYVGLNIFERVYYMVHYTIRGMMKWRNLKNRG